MICTRMTPSKSLNSSRVCLRAMVTPKRTKKTPIRFAVVWLMSVMTCMSRGIGVGTRISEAVLWSTLYLCRKGRSERAGERDDRS